MTASHPQRHPYFSHHAYLLIGETNGLASTLRGELAKLDTEIVREDFGQLGIKESRALRVRQAARPQGAARRCFIITIQSLTVEAQNALLKTLEEPAADVHFFLIVPRGTALLPTFRSRLQTMETKMETGVEENEEGKLRSEVKKFLAADPETRLEQISRLLQSEEGQKDAALRLVNQLELALASSSDLAAARQDQLFALEEIARARRYLSDKAGAARLVLEHLALIMPTKWP